MAERVAVIFGVTGVSGRAIAETLSALEGWRVVGVSRRAPELLPGVEHVVADLKDAAAAKAALAGISPVEMTAQAPPARTTRVRIIPMTMALTLI